MAKRRAAASNPPTQPETPAPSPSQPGEERPGVPTVPGFDETEKQGATGEAMTPAPGDTVTGTEGQPAPQVTAEQEAAMLRERAAIDGALPTGGIPAFNPKADDEANPRPAGEPAPTEDEDAEDVDVPGIASAFADLANIPRAADLGRVEEGKRDNEKAFPHTYNMKMDAQSKGEKGDELATLLQEIGRKEAEHKAANKDYKEEMDKLEERQNLLVDQIKNGYVLKDVQCVRRIDHEKGKSILFRTDNLEILEVRDLSPAEQQTAMALSSNQIRNNVVTGPWTGEEPATAREKLDDLFKKDGDGDTKPASGETTAPADGESEAQEGGETYAVETTPAPGAEESPWPEGDFEPEKDLASQEAEATADTDSD